jgi:hypothetical protein
MNKRVHINGRVGAEGRRQREASLGLQLLSSSSTLPCSPAGHSTGMKSSLGPLCTLRRLAGQIGLGAPRLLQLGGQALGWILCQAAWTSLEEVQGQHRGCCAFQALDHLFWSRVFVCCNFSLQNAGQMRQLAATALTLALRRYLHTESVWILHYKLPMLN